VARMADPSVVQTQSKFRLCYKQAYAWTMIEVNFRSRDRLDRLALYKNARRIFAIVSTISIPISARMIMEASVDRSGLGRWAPGPSGPRRPASSSCGAAGSRRRHQRWRDSPKRTGLRLGTERQWFRPPGAPKAL
jgi:hypothetical protein